ncbi:MAG: hypothetical protein J5757_09505 [Lachnospiraceae bacterium]|nr:hypothetical protein [Lachnospiraceae bacterium]
MKRLLSGGVILLLLAVVFYNELSAPAFGAETLNGEASEGLRAAVVINRMQSTFSDVAPYGTDLQYQMNCYGYALHVFNMTIGNASNPYKQQPGEFAHDTQTFQALKNELAAAIAGPNATANGALNTIEAKMTADIQSLNTYSGTEWTIQSTTANASVPSGYRKIALAIDLGYDYHFYFRHSNGTWSHKRGPLPPQSTSITTGVQITDINISSCVIEGGYNDGVRYYLIGKSAIVDYAHDDGHSNSSLFTSMVQDDHAGEGLNKSTVITGSSFLGRFDYHGDVDSYAFTPSVSGTYTLTTSLNYGPYDTNIQVFNTNGGLIASDLSVGNANLTVNLTVGQRYFIQVSDGNNCIAYYVLYYTH